LGHPNSQGVQWLVGVFQQHAKWSKLLSNRSKVFGNLGTSHIGIVVGLAVAGHWRLDMVVLRVFDYVLLSTEDHVATGSNDHVVVRVISGGYSGLWG